MQRTEAQYMAVVNNLTSSNSDVFPGKMMSSPGLKYKDKVLAFYNKEAMGFRLGPKFNPEKHGVLNASPLSPFKTKPPLKGWFIIDKYESNLWETIALMALEYTMTS